MAKYLESVENLTFEILKSVGNVKTDFRLPTNVFFSKSGSNLKILIFS